METKLEKIILDYEAIASMNSKRTTSTIIGYRCPGCGSLDVDNISLLGVTAHVCNECGYSV